ncbi:hypothetical protein FC24_GL000894 [Loigolactobacillus rennini DSM 20253]|uniref:Uncharacterized protein n=1 Tax=Loigolactobacillus rennini DSM 20253 TaxID=1423796 RepID=A0A0R2CMP9_9LACO|nr:hypothetical protein FC24_GL000894 [Loigolactobacillus rennini DSM 20253]
MDKLTPTQLIYQAWQKTVQPLPYDNGKQKIDCYFADPMDKCVPVKAETHCTICGAPITHGVPVKKALSSNYTNWDQHKAPSSKYVGPACYFTIKLNTKYHRMALDRYSFCATTDHLSILNRWQVRDYLIKPPKPPFVLVCTVSQQKHLALHSRISYQQSRFYCQFENQTLLIDPTFKPLVNFMEALYSIGISKQQLAQGKLNYAKLKDYDFTGVKQIMIKLANYVQRPDYELAVHVATQIKEVDALSYLNLTPRVKAQPERL